MKLCNLFLASAAALCLSAASAQAESFRGYMLWTDSWSSLEQRPYGVYGFDDADGTDFTPLLTTGVNATTAIELNGKYYTVSRELDGDILTGVTFRCYDLASGQLERTESFGPDYSKLPVILAFNPADSRVWAISYTPDNLRHTLAIFDPATFALEPVTILGDVNVVPTMLTLSINAAGEFYGVDSGGNLQKIDPATGTFTNIGYTMVWPQYVQSSAFDSSGKLWWAACTYSSSMLCTVDLSTGVATTVRQFAASEEFVGLSVVSDDFDPAAPARVADAAMALADGGLSGTLTFTAPASTVGGAALAGSLAVTVLLDGAEAASTTCSPGQEVSVPLALSQGAHTVAVAASAGALAGPAVTLPVWGGLDAPKAVQGLNLEIFDNGTASLRWESSRGGLHGGWCPAEAIKYRITRADGTVAAEAFSGTVFTEQLAPEIARHAYTVTPIADGLMEGAHATSNTVRFGSYVAVPASFTFDSGADFASDFAVFDVNADGTTWHFSSSWDGGGYAEYNCSYTDAADDYLILPPLRLEAGRMYRLSFTHSLTQYVDENLSILMGLNAAPEALTTELARFEGLGKDGSLDTRLEFGIAESGLYSIGFHVFSPANQSWLQIDNVLVEDIGAAKAPAQGSVTATVLAGASESVRLDVTAPELDMLGNALEELERIDVYRSGESAPAYSFTGAAPGASLSWTDTTPGFGRQIYNCVAVNSYGQSRPFSCEVFVGGYAVPYTEEFDNPEVFGLFEVLNLNGDTYTWELSSGGYVRYTSGWDRPGDDWLLTPKIRLSADRVYMATADISTSNYQKERVDLTVGPTLEPQDQTAVLELDGLQHENVLPYSTYVRVDADGTYHFGFHALSPKSTNYIDLHRFMVADYGSAKAPARVDALAAAPAADFSNACTLTFTCPASQVDGAALQGLYRVEIFRDGASEPSAVLTSCSPGASASWTDSQALPGYNIYSVVACNADGPGIPATVKVWVGADAPAAVAALQATTDATNAVATLTWEAPAEGLHNGLVDPTTLTYEVRRGPEYDATVIASGITELTFTDTEGAVTGGQTSVRYTVTAVHPSQGAGPEAPVSVSLGALKPVPMLEGFEDWMPSDWTSTSLTGYNNNWTVTDLGHDITAFEGLRFLQLTKWNDFKDELAISRLESPKISLAGTTSPCVTLKFHHIPAADPAHKADIRVRINDTREVALGSLSASAGEAGWKSYIFPIGGVEPTDKVSIVIEGTMVESAAPLSFDLIGLEDLVAHNLELTAIEVPAVIGAAGAEALVTVTNRGLNDAADYTVTLLRDGAPVQTLAGTPVTMGEACTLSFPIAAPTATEQGSSRRYSAYLTYAADQKESDNASQELTVAVFTSPCPTVADLAGTPAGSTVNLTWSTPGLFFYAETTDDFCSYEAWIYDGLGSWTMHDGDQQRPYGIRYGLVYPGLFEPKAWQVFNPDQVGLYGEDVAPRSGRQCLFSMAGSGIDIDDNELTPYTDNWIISEEVAPGSQVSFFVKQPTNNYGNEAVQFLVSSTGTDPESFTLVDTYELSEKAVWYQRSYTLPSDARFFAIRHNVTVFGLWLDDITCTALSNKVDLELTHYNVYRDGSLIGTSDGTSFVDSDVTPGLHSYGVAPVFRTYGEASISNIAQVNAESGLAGVAVGADAPVEYYNLQGIRVERPTTGIYLRRQGATVTKVYLR